MTWGYAKQAKVKTTIKWRMEGAVKDNRWKFKRCTYIMVRWNRLDDFTHDGMIGKFEEGRSVPSVAKEFRIDKSMDLASAGLSGLEYEEKMAKEMS